MIPLIFLPHNSFLILSPQVVSWTSFSSSWSLINIFDRFVLISLHHHQEDSCCEKKIINEMLMVYTATSASNRTTLLKLTIVTLITILSSFSLSIKSYRETWGGLLLVTNEGLDAWGVIGTPLLIMIKWNATFDDVGWWWNVIRLSSFKRLTQIERDRWENSLLSSPAKWKSKSC